MTVPHHSEPAREAVARAIHLNAITALPDEVWGLLNKLPPEDLRVIFARLADGALSASPAPAAGGLEAVHEALREAEAAFETIRIILIKELDEPGRLAFWRAVEARNALRTLLGFVEGCQGDDERCTGCYGTGYDTNAERFCHCEDGVKASAALASPAATSAADLIRWAHDTLKEINPSNYDHDDVCALNAASVEVILGLASALGETHGKTAEWWENWRRDNGPAATSGSEYAGDITPHDDKERGLAVLRDAYDFDIADDGTLCGLVAGDQGWASTHIRIKPATSAETQGGDGVREALEALYEWYDRDGSVGGAGGVFEKHRAALAPSTSAAPAEPVAWRWAWLKSGLSGFTSEKPVEHEGVLITSLYAHPAPTTVESAQVKAWGDVLDERRRQVEAEGWTPAHDDEHDKGEMAGAAAVYALHDATYKPWQPPEPKGFEAVREAREEASKSLGTLKSALASMRAKNPAPPRGWPWHIDWWKPASRRRNLVKAGALILAEIERLDRASLDLATDAEG